MDLTEKLKKECPFPSVWEHKGENGRPVSELGYFRADYDGYKWWNTVWPVNKELETPELVKEFDALLDSFYETFPTLSDMTYFCMSRLDPLNRSTEYDAYLDLGGPGFYRFRMIARKGDYNLYLYCFSKAMIEGDRKSGQ